MSTIPPKRKPSRMPFFTQAFRRQPVGKAGSASAARIWPAFSAALNRAKSSKCCSVYFSGLLSKRLSISACKSRTSRGLQQPDGLEHLLDFLEALGFRRAHGETVDGVEEAHQAHRGFHRDWIGFDEVDV